MTIRKTPLILGLLSGGIAILCGVSILLNSNAEKNLLLEMLQAVPKNIFEMKGFSELVANLSGHPTQLSDIFAYQNIDSDSLRQFNDLVKKYIESLSSENITPEMQKFLDVYKSGYAGNEVGLSKQSTTAVLSSACAVCGLVCVILIVVSLLPERKTVLTSGQKRWAELERNFRDPANSGIKVPPLAEFEAQWAAEDRAAGLRKSGNQRADKPESEDSARPEIKLLESAPIGTLLTTHECPYKGCVESKCSHR